MLTEVVLFLLSLLCIYIACRKPPGLPPGPWGLPLVGKFPSTSVRFGDQVKELRDRYGDIILWRVGGRVLVFLCNHNIIKRAFNKVEFTERPDFSTFINYAQGSPQGVIFSNGNKWTMHRRFVLHHLRNLGMGKTKVEQDIQEEAVLLVEDFKKRAGKNVLIPMSIGVAVLNVICQLVANTRYEMDDPRTLDVIKLIWTVNEIFQGNVSLFNFFPWLEKYSPQWLKRKLGLQRLIHFSEELNTFVMEHVKQHEKSHDPNDNKDLIDEYLSVLMETNDPDSQFNMADLSVLVMDLFSAGVETTSSTIRWFILYLAKYPKVQERVHQEIDDILPRGTTPYYKDRTKLPYFEAVLSEVYRITSLAPLGIPHMASQDTMLDGYIIPKGTVILPHLECCHKDPTLWERPNEFYPEHFLDTDGKFVNKEGLTPFSIGRRVCLGESLARVELVIILITLFQNFSFKAPEGEPLSTANDPKEFVLNAPKPYRIIITERH